MTPTARSLKYLRDRGYVAGVVERFNSFTKRRHDLMGFIDIVAVRGVETLGVQATSGSNVSARMRKAMEQPDYPVWCQPPRKFVVHGWSKRGKRGERKTWQVRELWPEETT